VVAVILGPAGIALMGQFSNFVSMTLSFSTLGMNMGVTKYVAEYKDDENARKNILSTSFLLISGLSIVTSIVVFIGRNYFSETILLSNEYVSIFTILSFTLIFYGLNAYFIAVLNGYKEFRKVIITGIVSSIGGLIITVIFVNVYGVYGALLGSILSQTLIFFFNLRWIITSEWFNIYSFFRFFKKQYITKLGKYTLMALASMISVTFIQLQVRTYIINHLSIEEAGYWQGVTKISGLYLGLITGTFGLYYLPKLSELKTRKEIRQEIFKGYKFILPITIFLASMVFLMKNFMIDILFSNNFAPMKDLFLFQLIGDVFKIAAFILGFLFHAKALFKSFIVFEFLFGGIYFLNTILLINGFGLYGTTIAYAITYFIHLIILIFFFRNILFIS
jgi:PST family polysaccharide transporter